MDFWPEIRVDFTSILFLFFCLMVLIQLWYVLLYPLRLAIHKKKQTSAETPSVSVIVCARNEEDNLFKNHLI